MIDTIIFDFGDVFINLDKEGAINRALNLFRIDSFDHDMIKINQAYETGLISTDTFENFYLDKYPFLSIEELHDLWNGIILDFPEYRLKFLKTLRQKKEYELILLSNTNTLHIDYVKQTVPFYNDFKKLFDGFYLSHIINSRKPDREIFEKILDIHSLNPKTCLFIDDTPENTQSADLLGIKTWTLDPSTEDIIELDKRLTYLSL
ncbi:MAG: HAD family phosphatase [Flavobacteriaceae bacterium]|nr:HAD family phosphatase [Bacteroidia bacterium]NNF74794.1 HAD family phosphatase [Flavobacteriaceae bacterium]NNK74175.1 HAD family phosphatase [Flavobacteriaceae bacterium]